MISTTYGPFGTARPFWSCPVHTSSSSPAGELGERLRELGCAEVETVDPTSRFEPGEGVTIDEATAQRIAPAIGAALARGR